MSNDFKTWIDGASLMFLGSLFQSRGAAAWKALSPVTDFVFRMWSREVSNEERVAYVTVEGKTSSLKYSGARL